MEIIIGLGLVVGAFLIWKYYCKNNKTECLPGRPKEEKRFGNGERDLVDESIDESFPASDPPAHSRILEPAENSADEKKEP